MFHFSLRPVPIPLAAVSLALVAHALVALGCGDGGTGPAPDDAAVPDGAARGAPCPGTRALAPLAGSPRFAVVMSDYASTAIAMLDASGAVLDERWVDSGTTHPGLVATLSGDVVLPTRQAGDGTLTLLDRYRTDVVTRFCLSDGSLVGQVRTHGAAIGASFSSNPQDVLFVDAHEAWVTRYETALDPSADELDRGSDLLRFDPIAMTRGDERIDLSSLGGTSFIPDATADVLARPMRVVRLADRAVVGLDRLSAGFDAAGEGMLAIVETTSHRVTTVELPGLASCGHVVPVPGAPGRALVTCSGFPRADATPTSGLALVEIGSDGQGRLLSTLAANDAPYASAIALGGTRALAVVVGDLAGDRPDRLVRVDLSSGDVVEVHASARAFELGVPALDDATGLVLVPDASAGVAVMELAADGSLRAREVLPLGITLGLPPRHAAVIE